MTRVGEHRTEFSVVFDGVELTPEQRTAIADSINSAVAETVAGFDLGDHVVGEAMLGVGGGLAGRAYTVKPRE